MHYVIHYDVAAILLTAVVAFDYKTKQSIKTEISHLLEILIVVGLATNILDIVTIFTINEYRYVPVVLNYGINVIYQCMLSIMPAIYCRYAMMVAGNEKTLRPVEKLLIFVPLGIVLFFVVTTPLTHLVFYFDPIRGYMHGPGQPIIYIGLFFQMIDGAVQVFRKRKSLPASKQAGIYFFVVAALVPIAWQFSHPEFLMTQFAIALGILIMYTTLEDPEYYLVSDLGIYNVRAFLTIAEREEGSGRGAAMLGIRLDNFYALRDSVGNGATTEVVRKFVNFLLDTCPQNMIFQLDEDKFAILFGEAYEIRLVKEKIEQRLFQSFNERDNQLMLEASFSTVSFPEDADNARDALDLMRYSFDRNTKPGEEGQKTLEQLHRQDQILNALRKALAGHGLTVYYQPIYSVTKKQFYAAEALVRLEDEELGEISPSEFIPIAEENGLILAIGDYVFREACQLMQRARLWENGIEVMDINLSVVQCMQEDLADRLLRIMDDVGISHHHISLDITEKAAVASGERLRHNMEVLADAGVRFAVDAYGAGFSNILMLVDYPFSTLKIDRNIIWSSVSNQKALCVLRHTLRACRDVGLQIVAVGIETEEQAELMESMDCDFLQGFLRATPLRGDAFIKQVIESGK